MAGCHVCGKTYNHDRPSVVAQATKCAVCGNQSCSRECGEKCCAGLYSCGSLDIEKVTAVVEERDALKEENDVLRGFVEETLPKVKQNTWALGDMVESTCKERDALWDLIRNVSEAAEKIMVRERKEA